MNTCDKCNWFKELNNIIGECHRNLPVLIDNGNRGHGLDHWVFPIVGHDDFCGEFSVKKDYISDDLLNKAEDKTSALLGDAPNREDLVNEAPDAPAEAALSEMLASKPKTATRKKAAKK